MENESLDEDTLAEAYTALVDGGRQEPDPIKDTTAWCANALLDLGSQFGSDGQHWRGQTRKIGKQIVKAPFASLPPLTSGRGATCARIVVFCQWTILHGSWRRGEAKKRRAGTNTLCAILCSDMTKAGQ